LVECGAWLPGDRRDLDPSMPASEAWHVDRTMRILELLAFAPLSAPQLAAALHAHPRTIRRVLARLADEEYVTRSDDGRRVYEPTMRLVALAAQIVESSPLARRARPYVALLHERTGAVAHLVVPSYQSVLCLVHCGPASADLRPRMREVVPAHCAAGGKALLAWRDGWRESVLAAPLARVTDRTTVDADAMRRELDAVRRDGHAVEDGELEPGVRAVAAPVFGDDSAVGALVVSGRRLDIAPAAHHVRSAALDLREDLTAKGQR
jgi:DNA-binding IclR family transcriptional regulator